MIELKKNRSLLQYFSRKFNDRDSHNGREMMQEEKFKPPEIWQDEINIYHGGTETRRRAKLWNQKGHEGTLRKSKKIAGIARDRRNRA